MDPTAIVRDENTQRFETEDKKAFLEYRLIIYPAPAADAIAGKEKQGAIVESPSSGEEKGGRATRVVMEMMHTYVPRSKRGMGLASRLCAAAFSHAQNHSMLVIPTCSYISETFLPRNPSWSALVYNEELQSSL